MRFEKVILHIGLGKTGSTAIQQGLLRHANDLECDCDALFPSVFDDPRPFAGNHSVYLRSLSSDAPQELRVNIAAGLDSKELVRRADEELLAQYQQNFSSSNASTLILSAESVGHFDTASTHNLARWLFSLTQCVEIVACIRHPRHALAAEIQQRLKTGGRLDRLYQQPPFYRYSDVFSRLSDAFGRDSLRLYDYAEVLASSKGAVGTFFEKLGLELPVQEVDIDRVNEALSLEATLLLDSLNRQRPLLIAGKRNPLRRHGDLEALVRVPGAEFRPPAAVYERLDEQVAPELAWLANHHRLVLDPLFAAPSNSQADDNTHSSIDSKELDSIALRLSESPP